MIWFFNILASNVHKRFRYLFLIISRVFLGFFWQRVSFFKLWQSTAWLEFYAVWTRSCLSYLSYFFCFITQLWNSFLFVFFILQISFPSFLISLCWILCRSLFGFFNWLIVLCFIAKWQYSSHGKEAIWF